MADYHRKFRKAKRLLSAGQNKEACKLLLALLPIFIENPEYYALYGRALSEVGKFEDAELYLNRGIQAAPANREIMQILAVNHLRRKDTASAIRTWLSILEQYPRDKYARKGLRVFKRFSSLEQQNRFLARFKAERFMPAVSSRWPMRVLLLFVLSIFVLTALHFTGRLPIRAPEQPPAREKERTGTQNFMLNKGEPLHRPDSADVLLSMSDREITRTFRKAMMHFRAYEDNSARFELNKILNSNASDNIINRAETLVDSLGEADINSLETAFSFEDVMESPQLYEGCLVLWKGRTANIHYDDDAIHFDFLVGFEEGTVLKGRVPVDVPFPVVMEPLPLELLAAVEVTEGKSITLEARTLHFLR